MTTGGDDQYREQYREDSFPPAPTPPWADPPTSHQAPPPGAPSGQQPAWGQDPGASSGQQPAWGQDPGASSGQQPAWGQDPGAPSGQQPAYGQQPPYGQQTGAPSGQQPAYGQSYGQQQTGAPSGQQPAYGQTGAMPAYSEQQQPYGYGQQQPYGQQSAYGQSPWGSAPPGYGQRADYASWGARAGALILDGIFGILLFIPAGVAFGVAFGNADTTTNLDGTTSVTNVNGALITVAIVLAIAALAVGIWNQGWRQGSQGWSWGKQIVGIKLVKEATGQPPGGGLGIGRLFLRQLLGIVPFYTIIDYLFPLWDEKNQTIDDKILSTLVVKAR